MDRLESGGGDNKTGSQRFQYRKKKSGPSYTLAQFTHERKEDLGVASAHSSKRGTGTRKESRTSKKALPLRKKYEHLERQEISSVVLPDQWGLLIGCG